MASLAESYVSRMRKQFKRAPIWLPTERYELGDYGFYKAGEFFRRGNVYSDFGVDKPSATVSGQAPKFSYIIKSEKTTSAMISTTVTDGSGQVEVSLKIGFQKAGGFVLQLHETSSDETVLTADLAKALLAAYDNGRWDDDYRVIRGRVTAAYIKFAFAESKGANIELVGRAKVQQINVASLELGIRNSANMNAELWQASGEASPLVSLAAFSKKQGFQLAYAEGVADVAPAVASDRPNFVLTDEDSFPSRLFGVTLDTD